MPKAIVAYVRFIDSVSHYIGLFAMYLVFAMLGVLLWASFTKTFFLPSNWTVEMAQFIMVAYYLLGGAYSLKNDEHVRMDLLYGGWPTRRRAQVDLFTDLTLIFFLVMLLIGGVLSTIYAFDYGERSYSAWRPYMLPIKLVMTFGIFLTLLQAVAIFFRDWATIKGKPLP